MTALDDEIYLKYLEQDMLITAVVAPYSDLKGIERLERVSAMYKSVLFPWLEAPEQKEEEQSDGFYESEDMKDMREQAIKSKTNDDSVQERSEAVKRFLDLEVAGELKTRK